MSEEKRYRVAIIVQRYGEEVGGGAELHARWLAEHLTAFCDVEVFTSCALDYLSWRNHFPAGISELNGVTVHRFEVEQERMIGQQPGVRNAVDLLYNHSTPDESFNWMWRTGPSSTDLLKKIESAYDDFDIFIFFTFEYASTFFGLPLVSDKAILIPTAHDQLNLRMPIFRWLFHLPRFIAYNTESERTLVNRIWHNERISSEIVGIGINVPDPETVKPARFLSKYGLTKEDRFICYLGRMVAEKGVDQLINYYIARKEKAESGMKLVLMGPGSLEIPERDDIISTGFVSEEDKFDGLSAADALVVPSKYESLSMIAQEAWLVETPVIANGKSDVLVQQCRKSRGGLYYTSQDEFGQILSHLQANPEIAAQMGLNGKTFVRKTYAWDVIMEKYQKIFETVTRG
ncbi:MAG: glycosyltransferase family 4 protein [Chloroflexota bacterium]